MRLIGFFLTLCAAMAVLRAIATVLALAIVTAFVTSLLVQPKQTIGYLIAMACLGMIGQYPGWALIVIGAVIIAGRFGRT